MGRIELAYQCALAAHNGQLDKAGRPYIEHPVRVGKAVAHLGEEYEIVGILHDVVEDTPIPLKFIRTLFDSYIAEAVLSVTRLDPAYEDRLGFRVEQKETYKDFLFRSAENKIGKIVKLADIEDNMSPERFNALPDNEKGMIKRYVKAKRYLLEGIWE